jgi:hypothetical protein
MGYDSEAIAAGPAVVGDDVTYCLDPDGRVVAFAVRPSR